MRGTKVLKQGLVCTVSAYLSFSVLFTEDGELSRYLLREGGKKELEQTLPKVQKDIVEKKDEAVKALDSAEEDAKEDIRSLQEEAPPEQEPGEGVTEDTMPEVEEVVEDNPPKKDILVVTMGELASWSVWQARLGVMDASLTLLYGSYNEAIPENEWENEWDLPCQTAFIPDTTWTQGRNLLAAEAIRMERRRGKEFDYWVFIDDDLNVLCQGDPLAMDTILGKGDCWQKVFNYIGGDQVPENASTISLETRAHQGFAAASTADAMFAAFKRSHVPYILPYANLPEGFSEWTSQGALFCIMETCMKSSIVMIPFVRGMNPAHRAYTRGLNYGQIMSVVAANYHNAPAGFLPCAGGMNVLQLVDFVGPFATMEELNDHISPTEFEMCVPMKERFEGWDHSITI